MSERPSVDTLLEQCILALENDGDGGADAVLAANPDHAATLRSRLDDLRALGILSAPRAHAPIPEQLGEFKLRRQIGRGGMGIVYLAEQTSLQRDVALKLVHPQHLLFPGARERFRREVLAIARLQHPGIVPILTGGEADGIPFYAMELVAGASLAEVLGELAGTAPPALDGPALAHALRRAMAKKHDETTVDDASTFRGSWPKVACRLVLDGAEALQHAHEQGVLHRDLKPSNLLLTATGRVRLIDFGLAISEGEQRITRSGSTFGSLPYMAPEQVRGETQRSDARTDVYQLGVTLYELLALALPHGDGSAGTRERILAGHVEPPSRKNPQVHADAEAVCLKAMDVDPARRYATAGAFAADLRAFVDGRSVQARRPGPALRLVRWARHRPRHAAAVVLVGFVFVAALALALQQRIANTSITNALAIAEQNLDQALGAVDQMLLRTAEARLADVPRTAALRRDLLHDAVGFYERLVTTTVGDDSRVREARAHAQLRLGMLHTELGGLDQSLAQLTQARDALVLLAPASTHADRVRSDLARCDDALAIVYGRTDKPADAAAALDRSLATWRELAARRGEARYVDASLRAQVNAAKVVARTGDFQRGLSELDDVDRQLQDTGSAAAGLPPLARLLLATEVADHRGVFHAQRGDTTMALDAFRETLRRAEAAPDELAADPGVVSARLGALERLGLIHNQRREWDQAQPFLDRACDEYERLIVREPEYPMWRFRLARLLNTRATNCHQRGDDKTCGADHDRAIDMLTAAVEQSPDDAEGRRTIGIAYAERADWRMDSGDRAGALADFARAEAELERCLQVHADSRQTISNLAAALGNHTIALCNAGEFEQARPLIERAIELTKNLTGPEAQRSHIEVLARASDVVLRCNDEDGAERYMREAAERIAALAAQRPDDVSILGTATYVALNHGTLLLSLRRPDDALETWNASLPLAERAAAKSRFARTMNALLLLRIADLHTRHDRIQEAREAFAAALRAGATKQLAAPCPPLPELFDRADLADLVQQAGDTDKK